MVEVGPDLKRLRDYVAGRLSEQNRLELEERMESDPTLVHELEQLLRFREGLQVLVNKGYLRKRDVQPRRRLSAWVPFLAAAAIAAIALLLWQNHVPDAHSVLTASVSRDQGGVLMPVAAHFTFVATRGGSAPDLVPPPGGLIEFRVSPGIGGADARYRVTLTRTDEEPLKPVGTLSGLTVAPDDYVHAFADASRLSPGNYVLRIEPESGPVTTHEAYPFSLHTR